METECQRRGLDLQALARRILGLPIERRVDLSQPQIIVEQDD
jgi:hypothetical protein